MTTILIGFVLLVVLLIMGVPVLYCFGATIILYAAEFGHKALGLFPTMFGKLSTVTLLTIPLFIMAGGIMERGKIADSLVDLVESVMRKIKGSLSIVTVLTSGVFGSISGSGAATLTCVGSIMLPKMRDKKYPLDMMAALVAVSAPLGMLIPPSAIQILIAWTANISVLACFLATVVPGLILIFLLSLISWIMLRNNSNIITREDALAQESSELGFQSKSFGTSVKYAVPALIMPFIILGGIYGGIMTPTEAAGLAVVYAIPVSILIYKGFKFKELKGILIRTSTSTGAVMVMVVMAMVLGQILIMENIPAQLLKFFSSISTDKNVILLMLNLFMVVIGMIMDDSCATMLITPLLMPVVIELGVSPYQMAAIIGVNLGMGNVTPPVAPFLYMSSKIGNANTVRVAKYTLVYIFLGYIPTLVLTTYIPEISTFLPKLILGSKFF